MIDTQLELFPDLDKELYIQQLEKKVRELTSENIRYAGVLYGFAFGNYENMKTYFTRFQRLDEFIDRKGMFHPETFLCWSMMDKKIIIQRTNAVFWSLRKDGSRIEPNYNVKELDAVD